MAELKTRVEGAVATVLFSNPPRLNAMTYDMWRALPQTIAALEADPALRVIVLAGDGDRAFVSGADISQFEKLRGTAEAQLEYNDAIEAAYTAPMRCSKPVIARIRGICMGGGLGLAAACDLRICSGDSVFRMPAARLGLGYSAAGIRRFMNVIGAANAMDIFMSARKFDAAEALRMGFVSRVVQADALERTVAEYCAMVAENAPLTVAAAKFAVQQWLKDAPERELEKANEMVEACFASADLREGRVAFMEKRKPVFQGR
ncbi:MAG: enoyl-CoA hydratase [Betaproteobacteria bacterium RIFCSPHIGHO2_12_FULL_69_13]|nr:MAG: enoyl-CoA hydratase [Betaproteobacteria bacterium RIFCSPHIGHO2_12_FULL_69_13]OGA66551.1 MAG: enoyl-CoA hydratase [Betaproteobacteria bacterium RIFCSPLOWO2_12_FULL_68_20]